MKINTSIGPVGTSEAAAKPKRATPTAGQQAATASEQVELSSLAARLQEASAAMADTPVVDSARVAEIKQAISQGQFKVNPEKIADGLLESVRQMLGRQQG
ncbi:MAG TPA: flagellar biosynthesis anti-sigma factor FlgM [Rhodocyclaceae bacterium]|nr:flagellar biosynthesis anti-sigma factor FlgM [Rhodocyclaceae bacterium]